MLRNPGAKAVEASKHGGTDMQKHLEHGKLM